MFVELDFSIHAVDNLSANFANRLRFGWLHLFVQRGVKSIEKRITQTF